MGAEDNSTVKMELRPNYFGVFINAGLALFIAAILLSREFFALALIFLGVSIYHIMHLKKVEVTQDAIRIRYPLALLNRLETIPSTAVVSFRFSGGHYTELGAVFVKYRKWKTTRSKKILVNPADARQLEALLRNWISNEPTSLARPDIRIASSDL